MTIPPRRYWSSKRGQGECHKWLCDNAGYAGDECLIWPYFKNTETGYGHLGFEGKQRYAHRLMCEMAHGPAPDDKPYCAHSCGNGHLGCVNPRHLSWKSVADNLLDRRDHGTVRANTNGHAGKLSVEQIAQIRALKGKKSQYALARMFGVKRAAIQYWHNHDKPHSPPQNGKSRTNQWYRRKKAEKAQQTTLF